MRSFRVSEHLDEMIKQECKRKRCPGHIWFAIDSSRFLRSAGEHRLQQRLQDLLQSFAAVLAKVCWMGDDYAAATVRGAWKFHGSSRSISALR
jgi:hypothetical protein